VAKKKANIKGKSQRKPGKKPQRKSWLSHLFHFIALPPVRRLILLVLILAVLFWQWSALSSWATNIGDNTLRLFGWGLVLIVIAIITLVGVIWRWKLPVLIFRWNRWLGSIAFILAVWGILAFARLGGSLGLGIIGYPDFVGILRIIGLLIIGVILVAPRACFRLVANFISWLGKQFERRPRPVVEERQPPLPSQTYARTITTE